MKQALAPILFPDHDKPAAAAKRTNPVAAAQRSDAALPRPPANAPPMTPPYTASSLLADLATICANHIQPTDDIHITIITTPIASGAHFEVFERLPPPRLHVVSAQPKTPGHTYFIQPGGTTV